VIYNFSRNVDPWSQNFDILIGDPKTIFWFQIEMIKNWLLLSIPRSRITIPWPVIRIPSTWSLIPRRTISRSCYKLLLLFQSNASRALFIVYKNAVRLMMEASAVCSVASRLSIVSTACSHQWNCPIQTLANREATIYALICWMNRAEDINVH